MSDADLLEMCVEYRNGVLDCDRYGGKSDGMCFAISAALGGYISFAAKIDCQLVEGEIKLKRGRTSSHFWLRLPDGRIIDATADQFNDELKKSMPPVYLGKKPRWYKTSPPVTCPQ